MGSRHLLQQQEGESDIVLVKEGLPTTWNEVQVVVQAALIRASQPIWFADVQTIHAKYTQVVV